MKGFVAVIPVTALGFAGCAAGRVDMPQAQSGSACPIRAVQVSPHDAASDAGVAAEASASLPPCESWIAGASRTLDALPFREIAAAVLPTFDPSTGRASVVGGAVLDCRGGQASAGYDDPYGEIASPSQPGVVTELGRFALGDGRESLWLGVGASAPGALQEERGFLAVIRLDGQRLVVDEVGPWSNTIGAPRRLDTRRIGAEAVYVEQRHFTGTGGGASSDGVQLWLERGGRISLAGAYVTMASDNRAFELPRGKCGWLGVLNAALSFGPELTIVEQTTWDQKQGDMSPCKTSLGHKVSIVTRVARWQGDHLVEVPPREKANPLEGARP
jgi:hypothetical protein